MSCEPIDARTRESTRSQVPPWQKGRAQGQGSLFLHYFQMGGDFVPSSHSPPAVESRRTPAALQSHLHPENCRLSYSSRGGAGDEEVQASSSPSTLPLVYFLPSAQQFLLYCSTTPGCFASPTCTSRRDLRDIPAI